MTFVHHKLLDKAVIDKLSSMFTLERDLVVNMEDFDTPVKLYSCKAGSRNTWNCKPGEQVVFIEDESNCFEINGWFLFNR